MKKSGQPYVCQVDLTVTRHDDVADVEVPANLLAVRRHVMSLEYERTTLAQTVQYARRNLRTPSYSQDHGQRVLSAAELDLDTLDRSLSRARLSQAMLEAPATSRSVGKLKSTHPLG